MAEQDGRTAQAEAGYEALVRQAQAAHGAARKQAFEGVIAAFGFAAQAWAYQILGDAHAAQDAAQEALITAYEKLDNLREPATFPTWLRRIVRTQCHRYQRAKHDTLPLDEQALSADDPAAAAELHILREQVRAAVGALPEHERAVVALFYLKGYSQQEIAQRLALPLTTVKKRLQYARERLREALPAITMRLGRAA
jgi:RNA polymerase sigma-70 factor (ECF subfamily)